MQIPTEFRASPDEVVAIVKVREPARILVAIGDQSNDSPHLEYKQRWVNQFNFSNRCEAFAHVKHARIDS